MEKRRLVARGARVGRLTVHGETCGPQRVWCVSGGFEGAHPVHYRVCSRVLYGLPGPATIRIPVWPCRGRLVTPWQAMWVSSRRLT